MYDVDHDADEDYDNSNGIIYNHNGDYVDRP